MYISCAIATSAAIVLGVVATKTSNPREAMYFALSAVTCLIIGQVYFAVSWAVDMLEKGKRN